MLVPRFSVKTLLSVTTVAAVVALVGSFAVREQAWALAVVIMIASVFVVFAVHAALFLTAWCFAQLWPRTAAANRNASTAPDPQTDPARSAASDARG